MQEWHFKVDGFMDILPRILAAVNNLDKGKAVCAYHQAKDKAPEPGRKRLLLGAAGQAGGGAFQKRACEIAGGNLPRDDTACRRKQQDSACARGCNRCMERDMERRAHRLDM